MKKTLAILSLAGLLAAQTSHAFNIQIYAGTLLDEFNNPLADGRQLLLVADADGDGFGNLDGPLPSSATSFTDDAGDVVIGQFAMDSATSGTSGDVFTIIGFTLGQDGVTVGDQFALVWYSAVNDPASTPGYSQVYGFYRDVDWVVPGSNGDDIAVNVSGSNLAPTHITQAIPEPTTGLLVAMSAMSLLGLFRRRK